jgi:UDP-3-O-[3-hydroxymyristoyl] glucosamine N-acyltransferase
MDRLAGVTIGASTVIGHRTLLRSHAAVGVDSQLGHNLTIERDTRVGDGVCTSPGSHLTAVGAQGLPGLHAREGVVDRALVLRWVVLRSCFHCGRAG